MHDIYLIQNWANLVTSEADMTKKLEDAWSKIPSFAIKDLIDSMPRRRHTIINSNGAPPNISFFGFVLPISNIFKYTFYLFWPEIK